jgi:hypothetical protein
MIAMLLVGIVIGCVIGALAVIAGGILRQRDDFRNADVEPDEGPRPPAYGWEKSARAMRDRQQANQ